MATCEYSAACYFYTQKLATMPRTGEFFREKFCTGKPGTCARFKRYTSENGDQVPDNLAPYSIRGSRCFYGL